MNGTRRDSRNGGFVDVASEIQVAIVVVSSAQGTAHDARSGVNNGRRFATAAKSEVLPAGPWSLLNRDV